MTLMPCAAGCEDHPQGVKEEPKTAGPEYPFVIEHENFKIKVTKEFHEAMRNFLRSSTNSDCKAVVAFVVKPAVENGNRAATDEEMKNAVLWREAPHGYFLDMKVYDNLEACVKAYVEETSCAFLFVICVVPKAESTVQLKILKVKILNENVLAQCVAFSVLEGPLKEVFTCEQFRNRFSGGLPVPNIKTIENGNWSADVPKKQKELLSLINEGLK